jgi:hypothetical protein
MLARDGGYLLRHTMEEQIHVVRNTSHTLELLHTPVADIVAALRLHYADQCCSQDLFIHHLIDFIATDFPFNGSSSSILELFSAHRSSDKYWISSWQHINQTLESWYQAGALLPDPWWGS